MQAKSQSSLYWARGFVSSWWLVNVLLASHFLLGVSAAARKSPTSDEGVHLSAGYSYWLNNDYRLNPESGNWPQRWTALPVWLAGYHFPTPDKGGWQWQGEYQVAYRFLYELGNGTDAMLLAGRAMIGLFSVGLGLIVYAWSRQLFGAIGGLISLTLYAFSPTVLSNGFLVTADLASALFFSAATWALWELLHRVSSLTIAVSCFTLAGLLLSKFSGVLIAPIGLLLVVIRLFNPEPLKWEIGVPREILGRVKQLGIFLGVFAVEALAVTLLIWASFGFRYSMANPGLPSDWQAPNSGQATMGLESTRPLIQFALDHHLLPEAYLDGLAYTLRTAQTRRAFLNGEFSIHGWLGFFPYCLLVKTPLEVFLILFLAATGLWFWRVEQPGGTELSGAPTAPASLPRFRLYGLAPLLVLLGVYWAASLLSHLNIGQRHLLPTYPPMFIFAGAAAVWFRTPLVAKSKASTARGWAKKNQAASVQLSAAKNKVIWTARALVVGGIVLAVVEGMWIWPDYLAYFNILAGGPSQGYKHLVDSSLDWGQDLKELKRWVDSHPTDAHDPERIYLSYFGETPPSYCGLNVRKLRGFPRPQESRVPFPLTGGTYCISATLLQGVLLELPGRWNAIYENLYQQARSFVVAYMRAEGNQAKLQKLTVGMDRAQIDRLFTVYEATRFARVCSFLRPREPDDRAGYSILIYRLSDDDIEQALNGPPVELLRDCEPEAKESLHIK